MNLRREIERADREDWWKYTITLPRLKRILYMLQDGNCAICNKPVSITKSTIEHVVPKSVKAKAKTYTNPHENNVLIAHHECNQAKGDSMPSNEEMNLLMRVNAAIAKHRMDRRAA